MLLAVNIPGSANPTLLMARAEDMTLPESGHQDQAF